MMDEFKFVRASKNESYKSLNNDIYKTGQPFYIPKCEICVIKYDLENDEKIALLNEKEAKNTQKSDFLKIPPKTVIKSKFAEFEELELIDLPDAEF
jgi:hypothetical protein